MQQLHNWREEQKSAYLYTVMAQYESDATKRNLFASLAAAAIKQAAIWQQELHNLGYKGVTIYKPDLRTRFIAWLLRYFSAQQLRFMLIALKVRGLSVYDQFIAAQTKQAININHELHNHSFSALGNLRAAVFGVNDGLISNLCLLMGMVGGSNDSKMVVLSGIAGLLAGSCSMAAGEYISMKSQQDFLAYQIALEKEELALYPEEEALELALIYQARGIPEADANELAQRIIKNPQFALDVLVREELSLNINDLGSPRGAAVSSFIAFAIGAMVPLLPFVTMHSGHATLALSITLTALALFAIGALLSLFSNQNFLLAGIRMLLIGAGSGCFAYFIGKLLQLGFFS